LDSLERAMAVVGRARRNVDIYVACCDDASDDGAAEYIERFFAGKAWFKFVRNQIRNHTGFCRNVAAAQFGTDWLCFLDTDDAFREQHLVVCADIMERGRSAEGRRLAGASTVAQLDVPVHPEWAARISATIPLTKVIDRQAWQFAEGMPAQAVYRRTSCEDQYFMQKFRTFFVLSGTRAVTADHYCYPGSALHRQLAKFQKAPELYDPQEDTPASLWAHIHMRRVQEAAFLGYLRNKWHSEGGMEQFAEFACNDPRLNLGHQSAACFTPPDRPDDAAAKSVFREQDGDRFWAR
jgi:hypothetical protein